MGYKNVCLNCKRVESLGTDYTAFRTGDCPECSTPMEFVSQKFRPPKRNDKKSWDVAALMISNGFAYYTIRDSQGMPVPYPTTLHDAERFIETHRAAVAEQNTRRKHEIEQQVSELQSREANKQRTIQIRNLRLALARLTGGTKDQMDAT